MPLRKIRLADHRGREATVVLVPRRRLPEPSYTDTSGAPLRFVRLVKATEASSHAALLSRFGDPESLSRALIDGDPEINLEAAGREAGPCDRVHVGADGKPLYSARMIEVILNRDGNEIARRELVETPANIVPDTPPRWSGKLIPKMEAARRYAFTRAYQVRHSNSLEYDFLFGLARYLEERNCLVLVGSGPKGQGPLILERNGTPMKGFLEGRTKDDSYQLVIHLATFELKQPEAQP
jgi:hypothetical protein